MKELVQILKNTRQHLMTGVSHMIPFVVAGGILLAVSVMLYGKGAVPDAATDPNLKKLFDIGVAGLTLMVPFLAAYIGYSIAERSALAPCAIGAWVGNSFGAGFFGALIAGIIGGIVVNYLKKIPVHKVLRSVMPIFVIPIIGTFITAGIMMWGLGEPVGALTTSLTEWLQGMQQGSIVLLAVIMGLMLAFDMGGPINKVAYAFMLICVAQGVYCCSRSAACHSIDYGGFRRWHGNCRPVWCAVLCRLGRADCSACSGRKTGLYRGGCRWCCSDRRVR